jgi:hypothetical protein
MRRKQGETKTNQGQFLIGRVCSFFVRSLLTADEWDLSTKLTLSEPIPRYDKKELIHDYVKA